MIFQEMVDQKLRFDRNQSAFREHKGSFPRLNEFSFLVVQWLLSQPRFLKVKEISVVVVHHRWIIRRLQRDLIYSKVGGHQDHIKMARQT